MERFRPQVYQYLYNLVFFRLAQKYLEQNESKVSRSHLYMEELKKRMRLFKRSFSNFKTYLIPWEGKIKKIESKYLIWNDCLSLRIYSERKSEFSDWLQHLDYLEACHKFILKY